MNKALKNISLDDLKVIAEEVAAGLKIGDVVCLEGDLGAGKTTFAGFLINSLLEKPEVITSPTFNLVHTYDTKIGKIWHFDMYRLKTPQEAYELGLEDALAHGISIIEWPQNLGDLLTSCHKFIINLKSDEVEGYSVNY